MVNGMVDIMFPVILSFQFLVILRWLLFDSY